MTWKLCRGAASTTQIGHNQDHNRDVDQEHEGIEHIGDVAGMVMHKLSIAEQTNHSGSDSSSCRWQGEDKCPCSDLRIAAAITVSPEYSHDAQDVTKSQLLQGKLGSRWLCTPSSGRTAQSCGNPGWWVLGTASTASTAREQCPATAEMREGPSEHENCTSRASDMEMAFHILKQMGCC